ncbi:sulfatase family protein [Saccharopolyspora sp. CA-218241]|uniref:sulfatase family protein n=1 Tax=Saccharopolyspora sp. CA-218241 TaxID=3240027 RepID=UPI003D962A59
MSTVPGGAEPWTRRGVLSFGGRLLTTGAVAGLGAGAAACSPADPPRRTAPDPGPAPRRSDPRPNIVFVMLDDAGYGDFGPHGTSAIRTPRIDQLAREGMTFNQMYAGAAVCTPSRAALLTGRYGARVGLPTVLHPWQGEGLPDYELTIAELLRGSGYRTGLFGKWHLGSRPQHNPTRHGFEEYFGLLHSNDQEPVDLHRGRQRLREEVDQGQLTRRYTDEAIGFIERHRDEPFFLYLPHTAPHVPLHPEQRFAGSSAAGEYGDVIQGADFHIGRVLDALDEHDLADNTIIMVTSDNGPWFVGSTGGLRGRKIQSYEGGVRVPFFLRWPSQVRAGSVCDAPASFLDMVPTLLRLAGTAPPGDRAIDGIDISPVLHGGPMPPREALYYFEGWSLRAVRSGPWKLHRPKRRGRRGTLFNIEQDPAEEHDRARDNPSIVRQLESRAHRFAREISAHRPRAIQRTRN